MFPLRPSCHSIHRAFLCLRRGVSGRKRRTSTSQCFSLPTQRCFPIPIRDSLHDVLFSAYAEVFPKASAKGKAKKTFLCLRRGVSLTFIFLSSLLSFSLPTQRCFPAEGCAITTVGLFSAYAEVFLTTGTRSDPARTFLCLRRGVSGLPEDERSFVSFSLPTQRCFRIPPRTR